MHYTAAMEAGSGTYTGDWKFFSLGGLKVGSLEHTLGKFHFYSFM